MSPALSIKVWLGIVASEGVSLSVGTNIFERRMEIRGFFGVKNGISENFGRESRRDHKNRSSDGRTFAKSFQRDF
jgi:hypothetical protein